MPEHVHEWRVDAYCRAIDNHVMFHVYCADRDCHELPTTDAVTKGLNATERLSAKVARRNGVILRINANRLSYGKQTQGFSDSQDLIAYADILEGKDD